MDFLIDSLRADWQRFLAFSPRLLYAAVLLVVFLIAGSVAGLLVTRVLRRSDRFRAQERFVRRLAYWAFVAVGAVLALGVMGFKGAAASLLATGGVAAVVLGFAFREIGENLLAGLFLSFSRPFEVDDLIMTDGLTGTVRSIRVRSVHIRTADACDVYVPSAQIFRQPLYNYTRDGLRRLDFTVGVAYHDAPQEVLRLLEEAVAAVDDVLAEPRPLVTIRDFSDSFVAYQVFFHTDVNRSKRGLFAVKNAVMTSCWRALREAGMTFSTDVTTALEIREVPALRVEGPNRPNE